ncbi:bifunctional 2-polyprenyl-6-hydroxyphenol methylase/3-demethylubiquinol 3-O-methyltransferase UbiG [Micromonospora sp. HK10]|uniref:class I SAM-dependent methyltransferase n=1 Tax=Micromonospora sp. HK10 TaxID=1538294 RepID=UPI00062733D4|nr:class I SAM-dependent methyltransferase [Micromonospora sp. HK10]KKK04968.1 SAM-dependent methyltransferase [Micromonospora sp. HK10]
MPEPSLWQELTARDPGHAPAYVERFRAWERDDRVDLGGEARLVDALAPRGARILDAGCGTGRVGARLHRLGHTVVGVDSDAQLLDAARTDHPGPTWVRADLAELDTVPEASEPFDVIVAAGNVMVFLGPPTRRPVLTHLRRRLTPDGRLVTGFDLDRGYGRPEFEEDARHAGLVVEHTFRTWDLRPAGADPAYVVYLMTPGTAE